MKIVWSFNASILYNVWYANYYNYFRIFFPHVPFFTFWYLLFRFPIPMQWVRMLSFVAVRRWFYFHWIHYFFQTIELKIHTHRRRRRLSDKSKKQIHQRQVGGARATYVYVLISNMDHNLWYGQLSCICVSIVIAPFPLNVVCDLMEKYQLIASPI